MSEERAFDVTFYAPWIGPMLVEGADGPTGGAETQIILLARGLTARGYRVCLITYDTEEGLPP
ncbi:MAG: hypothetical protein QOI80_1972, partial [Solirubrobacteraceae bacterium]|nr:hypothetical protein [Solirubrobacteraceae bacterium]